MTQQISITNNLKGESMKELVEKIIKSIIDYPDELYLDVIEAHSQIVIKATVNKLDIGKVIGKQGKNADAIRTILVAAGARNRKKITFEVVQ